MSDENPTPTDQRADDLFTQTQELYEKIVELRGVVDGEFEQLRSKVKGFAALLTEMDKTLDKRSAASTPTIPIGVWLGNVGGFVSSVWGVITHYAIPAAVMFAVIWFLFHYFGLGR